MNALSSPTKSFKVPNVESRKMGTQYLMENFFIPDEVFSNIYQASTLVRRIGELTKENEVIIRQIKSMLLLGDNWDTEGALAIPENVVKRAVSVVELIDKYDINVYLASPGPNQEIMIMLKQNLKEIELIIYPDKGKFVKFNGAEFVEQNNFNCQEIDSLLEWISNNE